MSALSRKIKRLLSLSGLAFVATTSVAHEGVHHHALTVHQVVSKALFTNPNIQSAIASKAAAKARIAEAQAGYLPTVALTMGRGYERTDTTLIQNTKLHRQENGISLTQTVFDGLGAYHQIKAQSSLYDFAEYELAAIEEQVALAAIESMLNVMQSEKFVSLGRKNVQKHRDTLSKAKARFKAGAGHQGDLSLVEGRLALAEATLERLKRERADAYATYEQIVGEPAGHFKAPRLSKGLLPENLPTAISIALETNPQLASADANVSASRYQIKQAKANFLPSARLELRVNNNVNLDGVRGDNQDRTAMLQVSYNLFNGGADLAQLQEAQALTIDNEMTREDTRRGVIEQVTREWNLWTASKARLSSLEKHVSASRVVLKAYKNEFKIGRRLLLNVLDQENELFQSEVEYRRGLTDVKRSVYRVLASLGQLVDNTLLDEPLTK